METIKLNELIGKLKIDEIYYFYKTSSPETNLEILSCLKKYQSYIDFFSYYTDTDIKCLLNLLNELDRNLMFIFNQKLNKFSTNTENYISEISKIILTLNLIQKNQEMLNSIISKIKLYFKEKLINFKFDNVHQEKLLSLINNLENNFPNDLVLSNKEISRISTKDNSCSSQISPQELLQSSTAKNITSINKIKINTNENFFEKNNHSIIDEECLSNISTPKFQNLEKKNEESQSKNKLKNYDENNNIQIESSLSLSEMIFVPFPEDKDNHISKKKIKKNKSNTYIKLRNKKNSLFPIRSNNKNLSESFLNQKSLHKSIFNVEEVKMFSDLLILTKQLYKFCLINSEEKIKFKKLVIEKSKSIFKFYRNEFKNNKNDYKKLSYEIKKLFKLD